MINILKLSLICLFFAVLSSCSQVLQTIDLSLNTEDRSTQEDFKVIEKTLNLKEAIRQNKSPYKRMLLQTGIGKNARPIAENIAIQSNFPKETKFTGYKLGIGDTLTFTRYIENNRSSSENNTKPPRNRINFNYRLGIGDIIALTLLREEQSLSRTSPNEDAEQQSLIIESKNDIVLETKGRIGSDGSVLLLEVGRLEANGKTLSELQSEVRNILIRNGTSPRFQLEIVEFQSQKAYLTINQNSKVIALYDQKTSLRDVLAAAQVGFTPGTITRVRLQRDGVEYQLFLRSIFSSSAPNIYIYDGDHIFVEDSSTNLISSKSRIDHDGNVVFSGIGKIRAKDLTLSELRSKISLLIEKIPGSENEFQIEISEFFAKTALVNIPEKSGGIVPISNTPVALDGVLTENGLSIESDKVIKIHLQRQGRDYFFTLRDLFKPDQHQIYLQPNDRVKVETLLYKSNKVFILGGVNPQIYQINPAIRETLADVLFTNGGVLSSPNAKRSEVYLLRGQNPVVAYKLDAQSPTRLIVAEAMELRPNDILYVAEQSIASFNRALSAIVPLRLLMRDIQDKNIP